jgi:uncharacterized repeat protein (TIGR01451 family)
MNAMRYCVYVVADIWVGGVLYRDDFWKLALTQISGNGTHDVFLTDIPVICGQSVELRDVTIMWDTRPGCTADCDKVNPAKCFQATIGPAVVGPLVADFDYSQPCFCNDTVFTDRTTGGVPPYTYMWQAWDSSGTLVWESTERNPTYHFDAGVYTVKLIVKDSSTSENWPSGPWPQEDSQSYTVQVWANPVANFSAFPTTGCAPLTVTFTDNSTSGSPNGGDITKWEWDFDNDGIVDRTDSSKPSQFTHEYSSTGTYTARLKVTDSHGCYDTYEVQINIPNYCCVPPSITCPGDITVFNESGKCGAVVTWSVSATGTPTPEVSCNPSSGSFFSVGTTTVTCTATNTCGTATCSFKVTVVDEEKPVVTCPVPASQYLTDEGKCFASLSFAAQATDNCGVDTIEYFVDGDKISFPYDFPVGDTTVQVVATDIHGNKSECTFTVTVKPSADLEIKKEAPAQVVAGESLTYELTITNNGPCSATNVVVTDTLPSEITEAKYMVNGTPQGDWTGNYTIDTLEPGLTVTITITGKVAPWATGTLTNTARVTSGTYDPDDKNNTATSTTTVEIQADISVTKKVSPTIAKPGDTITYTIEVTNNGPSDAPNVVVTDTLPQYITGATYKVDGTDKGNWTGSYTIGRMKLGDTVTITITGTVSSGASGTLTNTVVVELKPAQVGGQAGNDPEPGNNEDTATIIFAFYTGFEGWVSNGLWYIRRDNGGCFRCDKIQGEYVQFAKLEDCISRTYNLGTSRAYGVLTSPVIRPPAGATGWVMISIDFYRQVEKERPTGDYDRTYVQLSINGGSWQTIWSRSSRNGSEECGTITYVIQSMPKYFQIRFIFDSVDYRYNNYKGWAIDNVWAAVVPVGTQAKGEELLAGDLTSELTVINVPNPITDVHTTTFKVLGPLADSVERIRVRIFDLSGKLVWEGETAGNALEWHTTDFLGRYLANGVYLYQVQVYVGGTWITSDLQKLAIYR